MADASTWSLAKGEDLMRLDLVLFLRGDGDDDDDDENNDDDNDDD